VIDVVPTYQDAEIILKLYEQYESDRLRAAKKWFSTELNTESYEEFEERFPRGSEGFTHFIALYGFFEMVGVLFKNKLVHPDLLFDMWYINGLYSKMYPVVAGWRKHGDVHIAENFERLALAELEWIRRVKGEQYVPAFPYANK
jgi:hypothetical protein